MSYQKPHDPMAKIVIAITSVVLLTAVFVLVSNLYTTIERNSSVVTIVASTSSSLTPEIAPDSEKADSKENTDSENSNASTAKAGSVASAINDNLRRIGSADASAKSASSASRSGDEIFNTVCTACHTSGVLEAPKFGDKAAWEPRMANGFDALLTSAINGKGNMPAKGGDASLSDDEMKAAIIHILEKAGIDAGVSAASTATEEPSTATPATTTEESSATAPATTEESSSTATEKPSAVTEVTSIPAETTATPTEDTKEEEAAVSAPTTPEAAALATPIAEPKTVAPQAAPTAPVKDIAPTAPSKDPKPTATEAAAPAVAPTTDTGEGKKLYKTVCFTCHDAGVAGAPIVGNKEQWAPRIAQGQEAMYHTALNGKGAMPAKGGNPTLSDESVKAAVDYMVEQSN
jgi:cytochrome c5